MRWYRPWKFACSETEISFWTKGAVTTIPMPPCPCSFGLRWLKLLEIIINHQKNIWTTFFLSFDKRVLKYAHIHMCACIHWHISMTSTYAHIRAYIHSLTHTHTHTHTHAHTHKHTHTYTHVHAHRRTHTRTHTHTHAHIHAPSL